MSKLLPGKIRRLITVDEVVWRKAQAELREAGIPISAFINLLLKRGFEMEKGGLTNMAEVYKAGVNELLSLVPEDKLIPEKEVIEGVKQGVHETIQKRRAKVKRRS